MAEKVQDTILSSLADDLASNFFDGSASSNNVVLPESEDTKTDSKSETKDQKTSKPNIITNPSFDFDTTDLLGDFLEQKEPETVTVADTDDEGKRGPGRPKKTDNQDFDFNSLILDETLRPFDDDQPLNSLDELKELIKANRANERAEGKAEGLQEYKESLPEAVKMILDYTESGGGDITDFLKALGRTREISDLDIEKDFDRKEIVRQYYQIQGWTPEEIEEEIESLLDIGEDKLKNVASKLKPKLDRMQQEALEYQLEQNKKLEEQQKEAQSFYVKNVVDTLKAGNIGDIKLTKQEQKDLYSALVEERYPSINGGQTNRLGALLDKIQFVQPNYALLAEVTWHLSDPDGFKKKIRDQIQTELTADTVKKVKAAQGLNKSGGAVEVPDNKGKLKRLDSTFRNPFA